MVEREETVPSEEGTLGTFGGVFTPSILTILGVIMYLRFGWIVGNAGLIGTLIIVTVSVGITFLTSLSIASIATDQKVRIGGAYYMVSRSLGIEAGGAIGIPLYFALAFSVALYTVGFAESVVGAFPFMSQRWVGVGTTVFVAVVAMISAKAAIKVQYFIMAAIGLSLISLLFGTPIEESTVEMWGASSMGAESFWTVFAVFFPAVTGIMAGVNMSGDLKNPSESIPKGTFYAIGVGYLIYMALPVLLAGRADAASLIEDPLIMRRMAYWGDAILLGVWGATLSSAVGSILGGPRVLQALARDGILPRWLQFLGQGSGADDTPRYGTMLTLGVVLVAVWFGNLNVIAPILTMFFLTTYGVLNVAAGLEQFLGSPSFRPEFQVHWIWSFLGAIGCVAAMLLINPRATAVAVVVVVAIFVYLESRELKSVWGDLRRGLWMSMARAGLMRLGREMDPKSWRPHPLVLSGAPRKRWHLIDFANNITHDRGILTVSTILTDGNFTADDERDMEENIENYMNDRSVQALAKVTSAPGFYEGASSLIENYGIGALEPNTVVLGASDRDDTKKEFSRYIKYAHSRRKNVIALRKRSDDAHAFGDRRTIHVWWGGIKGNGGLLLILAYLLQSGVEWNQADVNVKIVVDDEAAVEETRRNLLEITDTIRIGATVDVIVREGRNFTDILHENSAGADLVMMGMAEPGENFEAYLDSQLERIEGLPTTALVLAGEEISFGEVLIQKDRMA